MNKLEKTSIWNFFNDLLTKSKILFLLFLFLSMENISTSSSNNIDEIGPYYLKYKRVRELEIFNEKLKKENPDLFVLGVKESFSWKLALHGNIVPNYEVWNDFGYIGAWQIRVKYLPSLGIHGVTLEEFKENPDEVFPFEVQLLAIETLINKNIDNLGWYYDYYPGKRTRGVTITEEGMIYAAHLGGANGLKRFFKYGKNPRDYYGTSIKDYLNYKNTFWYQLN